MTPLYPLKLKPIYKRAVWGGRRFESVLGRTLDDGDDYAESWEVCDHAAGRSIVENGPLAGTGLDQLVTERGAELLGRHHPQPLFPLLVKYLDAHQRLSIQVHPDDKASARMQLNDRGKTEAWVVVRAEPGSVIWAGLGKPLDRDGLLQAIREGVLEDCLHRIEPRAGDCYFLPAGTVHALGEGLLVAEIQTTSDATFRLHDWNRVDSSGQARPLHIEQALQAIHYDFGPVRRQDPQPTARAVERLVDCDKFLVDRWTLSAAESIAGDGRCHVLMVLEGAIELGGETMPQEAMFGQTLLVPAAVGPLQMSPRGNRKAVVLDTFLP